MNKEEQNMQFITVPTINNTTTASFALVEHKNNDTDIIEYGDVVGETKDYFLVKPHLRKEQNRWLKADCNIVDFYNR
jgi:hypothetical protein